MRSKQVSFIALAAALALPALAGGALAADRPDVRVPGNRLAGPAVQDTAAGRAIFTGKGVCHACHGPDARGTPLAPNLTDTTWINIDGSLESIVKLINEGVSKPKNAPAPMPPKGGASLNDEELRNVAAYVFSLSRPKS